jgi:hypothetical protein
MAGAYRTTALFAAQVQSDFDDRSLSDLWKKLSRSKHVFTWFGSRFLGGGALRAPSVQGNTSSSVPRGDNAGDR